LATTATAGRSTASTSTRSFKRAGFQQGDRLLEIEGKAVVPENAERLLCGRPGTSVTVTARRPYALRDGTLHPVRPRSLTFTVIRAPGKATRRRHLLWRA
jgi:C-terminal processing protease CtpA/Prc